MRTLFFSFILIGLSKAKDPEDNLFSMIQISDPVFSCQNWAINTVDDFLECGIYCSISQHCNTFYFQNTTSKCYTSLVVLKLK